jgi:mycothiol system anti-sigma-R factor
MKEPCREVLEELDVFLDGECGQSLEEAVRRHLGECSPCLQRADFQRDLRVLIASKCKDAAPSGLLDRIVEALKQH